VHLFDVVLFAHIAIAIAAFSVAAILHTVQWASRSATSVQQLRAWVGATHRLEPLFPILALILFLFGGWLLHLSGGEFRWGMGWVITSSVTLGIMEALGGAFLASRGKQMYELTKQAPDGPISAELRAQVPDSVMWIVSHLITGLALGVVYLMATKPNGWQSVLIVAIVGGLGAAVGAAGARVSSPQLQEQAPATA
jgi:hypothetical protein